MYDDIKYKEQILFCYMTHGMKRNIKEGWFTFWRQSNKNNTHFYCAYSEKQSNKQSKTEKVEQNYSLLLTCKVVLALFSFFVSFFFLL